MEGDTWKKAAVKWQEMISGNDFSTSPFFPRKFKTEKRQNNSLMGIHKASSDLLQSFPSLLQMEALGFAKENPFSQVEEEEGWAKG